VGLSAAVYLLVADRRHFVACALSAVPLAAGLAAYNWIYLGSPIKFGQTELWRHAVEKTGSPVIFQTPLFVGAVGSLFSPARGLFVYSPFLAFALWGAVASWRQKSFACFRPLVAAIAAVWLIEFKHFDWWSGWSYGYRHIVDTAVLLCLLMIPIFDRIASSRGLAFIAFVAVGWSIGLQALAVLGYDNSGWNAREVFVVVDSKNQEAATFDRRPDAEQFAVKSGGRVERREWDVDRPEYRWRLWSIVDNPIAFLWGNIKEGRRRRTQQLGLFTSGAAHRLALTYDSIGRTYVDAGQREQGEAMLREAKRYSAR
jgi:hypothetical protein